MQRGFHPRALVSAFASLAAHATLLAWLSFAFTADRVGRVSVLDVQVIAEAAPGKTAPRKAARRGSPGEKVTGGPGAKTPGEVTTDAPAVPSGPARASYIGELRAAIESVKSYPAIARARHQEGRVEVAFVLRKDGSITDVRVTRSSSSSILDEAGAGTLTRLARFKPIPDDVSPGDLNLVLPLEFRLGD